MMGKQKIATSMLINSYHSIDLFLNPIKNAFSVIKLKLRPTHCHKSPTLSNLSMMFPITYPLPSTRYECYTDYLHRYSKLSAVDISGEKVEKVRVRNGESERVCKKVRK